MSDPKRRRILHPSERDRSEPASQAECINDDIFFTMHLRMDVCPYHTPHLYSRDAAKHRSDR